MNVRHQVRVCVLGLGSEAEYLILTFGVSGEAILCDFQDFWYFIPFILPLHAPRVCGPPIGDSGEPSYLGDD